MAIQYGLTLNQNRLNQIESTISTAPLLRIFSGSAPANCAAADSGTLLATLTLPSDWLTAADSTPKVSLNGSWTGTASAGSAATPTHFRIWNSGATVCHIQGTCGIGSGDLQVNGTITNGQTVTVTSFQITAGNT